MLDELQTRQCWLVVTCKLKGVDTNILTVFAQQTVQICVFIVKIFLGLTLYNEVECKDGDFDYS